MAVEVTLGTGMSRISSISRDEGSGSDNDSNFDEGQQGRAPLRLSVPCKHRAIQTATPDLCLLALLKHRRASVKFPFLNEIQTCNRMTGNQLFSGSLAKNRPVGPIGPYRLTAHFQNLKRAARRTIIE